MGNSPSINKQGTSFSQHYISGPRIGQGTFASVRKCKRKIDGNSFAVKIVKKAELTYSELKNLREEISILQSLDHDHVVGLIDVFESHKKVKIVLELCEGGHLFDNLYREPNKRFSEKQSALYTYIIAKSLKHLHENNIVHRDLKPENILFTKDGKIKIADFGSAKSLKNRSSSMKLMNTEIGTPFYVAPEVLLSNTPYSFKADLWSLGVILYIMLSGYQPFVLGRKTSIHALYNMIINGKYNFKANHWSNIDNDAIHLIKRLMEIEQSKRITINELLNHCWILKHVDVDE